MGTRVIAVTRSAAKLELARRLGADEIVPALEGDPVAAVRALTGGHGADVVVQCVGSARQDEQAIAMGGPGGRVVLIGSSLEPFSVRAVDIFWRELAVLGSRGYVPDDIRDAIDLYLAGELRTDHLVETVRPLEQANEALDDLRQGRVFRSVLTP
jgi:threonine dehydrogenase-like Zn-dependent dehydrogenase